MNGRMIVTSDQLYSIYRRFYPTKFSKPGSWDNLYRILFIRQTDQGLIFHIQKTIWLQVYEICHGETIMNIKQEEIEETKANSSWTPRVITGGKSPPDDPNNPDWLSKLPPRTTVLIRNKKDQSPFLGQLTVIDKTTKSVIIFVPSQQKEPLPVDPIRFCRDFSLWEVIQSAKEFDLERSLEQQHREKGLVNDSARPVQRTGVEDFETP